MPEKYDWLSATPVINPNNGELEISFHKYSTALEFVKHLTGFSNQKSLDDMVDKLCQIKHGEILRLPEWGNCYVVRIG